MASSIKEEAPLAKLLKRKITSLQDAVLALTDSAKALVAIQQQQHTTCPPSLSSSSKSNSKSAASVPLLLAHFMVNKCWPHLFDAVDFPSVPPPPPTPASRRRNPASSLKKSIVKTTQNYSLPCPPPLLPLLDRLGRTLANIVTRLVDLGEFKAAQTVLIAFAGSILPKGSLSSSSKPSRKPIATASKKLASALDSNIKAADLAPILSIPLPTADTLITSTPCAIHCCIILTLQFNTIRCLFNDETFKKEVNLDKMFGNNITITSWISLLLSLDSTSGSRQASLFSKHLYTCATSSKSSSLSMYLLAIHLSSLVGLEFLFDIAGRSLYDFKVGVDTDRLDQLSQITHLCISILKDHKKDKCHLENLSTLKNTPSMTRFFELLILCCKQIQSAEFVAIAYRLYSEYGCASSGNGRQVKKLMSAEIKDQPSILPSSRISDMDMDDEDHMKNDEAASCRDLMQEVASRLSVLSFTINSSNTNSISSQGVDETISLLDRLVLHFANLNSDSSSNASLIQQSDIVFICKHTEAFRKHIRRRLDAKIMQCAAMKAVNLPPTTIHADDSLSSADYDETSVLALHEKLRRVFELLLFYLKSTDEDFTNTHQLPLHLIFMDCDAITGLALEPPLTSLHTVDMDRIKYLSTCIRDISNLETTLAEGLRQLSLCTYNLAAVFIKRSDNGSNAHFQLAFNLASISASSLESYIDHHRQENSGNKNSALENVAALCKRLNLCWSAAVSMTNYSDACDYLVKHINFATITEADKALLIAPQSASSPPTSPSSTAAMYKLIDTYIKCQLKLLTSHHDGNGNYSTLTSLLKREDGWKDVVILGELELLGLSEYSSSAFSSRIDAARLEICQKLETVYRNNQCPIRLSRILLERSKIIQHSLDTQDVLNVHLCEEAIDALKSENLGNDTHLEPWRKEELAITYTHLGIFKTEQIKELSSTPLKLALQLWKSILFEVTPLEFFAKAVATVNSVEVGQTAKSGHRTTSAVKQLKRGSKGSNSIAAVSKQKAVVDATAAADAKQSVVLNTDRAFLHIALLADYLDLMYQPIHSISALRSQLKLLSLSSPKVATTRHDEAAMIYAKIGLSFTELGYSGKAGIAFSQCNRILVNTKCSPITLVRCKLSYACYLEAIGNSKKSETVFNDIVVDASTMDQDKQAVDSKTEYNIKLLCMGYSHFIRAKISFGYGVFQEAVESCGNALKYLNKASKSSLNTKPITPAHRIFSNLQMELIKSLLDIYYWLGNAYCKQGFPREAEYYYKHAIEFADRMNAISVKNRLARADAFVKMRKSGYPLEETDLIFSIDADDQPIKDVVERDLFRAQVLYRKENYDQAIDQIQSAYSSVASAVDKTTIDALEKLNYSSSSANTPRERKILEALPAPNSPLAKKNAENKIEYECSILSRMESKISSNHASILATEGNLVVAEKTLAAAKPVFESGYEKAGYLSIISYIKYKKILSNLQQSLSMKLFCESASSLPFPINIPVKSHLKSSSSVSSSKKYVDKEGNSIALKSIRLCREAIAQAFNHCLTYGTSSQLSSLANHIAFLSFTLVYISPAQDSVCDLVMETCYYLELAKWNTARKDLFSTLYSKSVADTSSSKWAFALSSPPPSSSLSSKAVNFLSGVSSSPELARQRLNFYQCQLELPWSSFFDEYVSVLPSQWIVCSMSIDIERDELIFSRYESSHPSPMLLRLPLKRRDSSLLSYSTARDTLSKILSASNESAKVAKDINAKSQKQEWWKMRKALDDQLGHLLKEMDDMWIGGFKGVFSMIDYDSDLLMAFKSELDIILSGFVSAVSRSKKAIAVHPEICGLMLGLDVDASSDDFEDVLLYILDSRMYYDVTAHASAEDAGFNTMVDSIRRAISKYSRQSDSSKKHLVLILDRHLQMFPWESIPSLQEKSVSRLPSLSFLTDRIQMLNNSSYGVLEIDHQASTSYVLNPSGDLKHTEKEFSLFLKSNLQWTGIIGKEPDESVFSNYLETRNLFLYFGHGSGEQFVKGRTVKLLKKCAVTILMGCSSGSFTEYGEFDPYGMALNYIISGCPALVANLWDVTDKDIDRFSHDMFEKWGLYNMDEKDAVEDESSSNQLCEAVSKAREACQLRYLVGASPVVYGIPVSLKK